MQEIECANGDDRKRGEWNPDDQSVGLGEGQQGKERHGRPTRQREADMRDDETARGGFDLLLLIHPNVLSPTRQFGNPGTPDSALTGADRM